MGWTRYYLKQKYPDEALFSHNYETNHIVSLKEAVKWSLIAPLEARLVSTLLHDLHGVLTIANTPNICHQLEIKPFFFSQVFVLQL